MGSSDFKKRVAQTAIEQAAYYKAVFVEYEYLLCSEAFRKHDYYIIAARPDNYRHLIGVNTTVTADEFYEKCISGKLNETDFDFGKPGRSEKEVKGSVRRKIKALPHLMTMFDNEFVVQEDYSKNGIMCSFAATDCNITAGFADSGKSRPKTLLWGDSLKWENAGFADVILRRKTGEEFFSEVIKGDRESIRKYIDKISGIISIDPITDA